MLAFRRHETPRVVLFAAVGAFAFAIVWRVLTFPGFSNDHYVHLALAQQLLLGERPIRDFLDPGEPLMYLLSAAAQLVGGPSVGTEMVLVVLGFAIGAALTLLTAYRLSASFIIALGAALIEIAIHPRTYSYPKVLAYAAAAAAIVTVAAQPSRRRILLLAAVSAVAFLFRHDHGLFIGAASVICLVTASRHDGLRVALKRLSWWSGGVVAVLAPWILFVSSNGGLIPYFQSGVEFSRVEAEATLLRSWPKVRLLPEPLMPAGEADTASMGAPILAAGAGPLMGRTGPGVAMARATGPAATWRFPLTLRSNDNAEAWLFWIFWTLPVVSGALVCLRLLQGRERWRGELAAVAALASLAMLSNGGFLRDTLQARLPDAIVSATLLAAWLISIAWKAGSSRPLVQIGLRTTTVVIVVSAVVAIARVSDVDGQVDRSRISAGVPAMKARVQQISQLLNSPHRQNVAPPSRLAESLMPFFQYLDRCSNPSDRIILTSLNPEVLVLGGRGFAAGNIAFTAGYSSTDQQSRAIDRLRRQRATFALITNQREFRARFPRVSEYVFNEYDVMVELPDAYRSTVPILVYRGVTPSGIDRTTGWPCFR